MEKKRTQNNDRLVQLSARGQVTLPLDLRKALGLGPGDPLRASIRDGSIVLEPVTVLPAERYTDERLREFARAAEMPPEELAHARSKWNLPDA